MPPLQAEISTNARRDGRRTARRTLRLEVQALAAANTTKALIYDLSEAGLLLETTAAIKVGETLLVELPEKGNLEARIVWTRGSLFGCEFVSPVSKAVVSTALLRSPIEVFAEPGASEIVPKPTPAEYDYPAESTTSQTALGISLLVLLVVVISFLVALVSVPL